jgi:hypothetical protein
LTHPQQHHHQHWSPADELKLRQFAAGNTPTRLIAWQLGRTETAIYQHASELAISLKPVNQSPYNRRK